MGTTGRIDKSISTDYRDATKKRGRAALFIMPGICRQAATGPAALRP